MKKFNLFVIGLISLFLFNITVGAAPIASSNLDYSSCNAFADVFKTITNAEGSYYYKYCYRATCSHGVYNKANMVSTSAYRCQNGNGTPYTNMTGDGCKSYSGSCSTTNTTYCTKVLFVDCNRKADGSKFGTTTRKTTTKRTTTTTKRKTTKKTTTRRTTTKRPTTTKKTTTVTSTTIPHTTTSTTTTTKVLNNTNIKSIKIGTSLVDNYKNQDYIDVRVPVGLTDISVLVELEDPTSTYMVEGNTDIPEGKFKMFIYVLSANGTERKVTIDVVDRYIPKSNVCDLANIYIEDYPIDFSRNIYEYKLALPKKVTSLDLEIVPVDSEKATYEIKGNEKLKNKSQITVVVVAEDGSECNYKINISKSSDVWKYVLLIIVLLGGLGTAVYFLFKYLKKSKGKYKYE